MRKSEWHEKFSCSEGYEEFYAYFSMRCNDEDHDLELLVDVCGDEVDDVVNSEGDDVSVITADNLTNVITTRPEKIMDIYVDIDNIDEDDMKACGLRLHEGSNPMFKNLDRSDVMNLVGSGKMSVDLVLENDR